MVFNLGVFECDSIALFLKVAKNSLKTTLCGVHRSSPACLASPRIMCAGIYKHNFLPLNSTRMGSVMHLEVARAQASRYNGQFDRPCTG